MNQDQVKETLLRLVPDTEDFKVIFSGKKSRKVNGLYYPESQEIIIHNRNFENDNQLMYTAIHEFAHHLQYCELPPAERNKIRRPHTVAFRTIFHNLLEKAEAQGMYSNTVLQQPELAELAGAIQRDYITKNGDLMKNFGQALMEAEKLCRKHGARFEDFIERVLRMPRQSAFTLMKFKAMDLPSELGYDTMKTVASVRNQAARNEAVDAFRRGASPDQLKSVIRDMGSAPRQAEDPLKKMEQERRRILRSLESLKSRLELVEMEIEKYSNGAVTGG